MDNQEILQKAIEKAVGNGYSYWSDKSDTNFSVLQCLVESRNHEDTYCWNHIIFSHDFAKSFWGCSYVCPECGKDLSNQESPKWSKNCCGNEDPNNNESDYKVAWVFHLQQMVISEDPIKYLEKFI